MVCELILQIHLEDTQLSCNGMCGTAELREANKGGDGLRNVALRPEIAATSYSNNARSFKKN